VKVERIFLGFFEVVFVLAQLVHHESDENCEDGSEHHVAA
jgi:hypothetical protein